MMDGGNGSRASRKSCLKRRILRRREFKIVNRPLAELLAAKDLYSRRPASKGSDSYGRCYDVGHRLDRVRDSRQRRRASRKLQGRDGSGSGGKSRRESGILSGGQLKVLNQELIRNRAAERLDACRTGRTYKIGDCDCTCD